MGSESKFAGWLDRVESVVLSVASLVAFFESGLLEWDELVKESPTQVFPRQAPKQGA